MQVNITELQQHLSVYLKKVQEGEEIQVTARGKIIARIVPVSPNARKEEAMRRLIELRATAFVGDIESASGKVRNARLRFTPKRPRQH
jgi:prevent-host-death family protein